VKNAVTPFFTLWAVIKASPDPDFSFFIFHFSFFQMDKKIWLKVIKDELTLLDELATGMIGDISLSREEVELAITRSKIVVQEFEMLLNQFSSRENAINVPHASVKDELPESPSLPVSESPVLPVHESPSPDIEAPSLGLSVTPSPVHEEIPSSPGLSVSPSPSLPVPESPSPDVALSPPRPLAPSSPGPSVSWSPGLIPEALIEKVSESPLRQAQGPGSLLDMDPSTLRQAQGSPGSGSIGVAFAPSLARPLAPASLPQDDRTEYTQYFKIEPLKSLKEGLSLNDRYLFQRELFNNDKSSLDETIATLDRLDNIKEAVDYLKANFKWNKSEAADKFVTLIKRRFSETKG